MEASNVCYSPHSQNQELKSELLESCPRGEEAATQPLKVLCLNAKNLHVGQETYPFVTFSLAFSFVVIF